MTSEPTSPAAVAGDPEAVTTPVRPVLPWRGFLVDCLLSAVLLVGLSLLLIVPIVLLHMAELSTAGKPVGAVPDMREIMPAITAAAIAAMLLTALTVWWVRGRNMAGTMVRMASISSVIFMLPSSAPMLLAILPAKMRAMITGPISRIMAMPTMAGI